MNRTLPVMRVEVLVFGPVRAAIQRDRVTVDVVATEHGVCTAGEVLKALQEQHPALRSTIGSIERARLAVNQRYADGDAAIRAGDEVALIAMVGGG